MTISRSQFGLGVAAAAALLAGSIGGAALASGQINMASRSADPGVSEPHKYPSNESGLTYGSLAEAAFIGNEPDLVAVEMLDGSTAYVYWNELDRLEGGDISTPEEAAQWELVRESLASEGLTAYGRDGKTILGTWLGVNTEIRES